MTRFSEDVKNESFEQDKKDKKTERKPASIRILPSRKRKNIAMIPWVMPCADLFIIFPPYMAKNHLPRRFFQCKPASCTIFDCFFTTKM